MDLTQERNDTSPLRNSSTCTPTPWRQESRQVGMKLTDSDRRDYQIASLDAQLILEFHVTLLGTVQYLTLTILNSAQGFHFLA